MNYKTPYDLELLKDAHKELLAIGDKFFNDRTMLFSIKSESIYKKRVTVLRDTAIKLSEELKHLSKANEQTFEREENATRLNALLSDAMLAISELIDIIHVSSHKSHDGLVSSVAKVTNKVSAVMGDVATLTQDLKEDQVDDDLGCTPLLILKVLESLSAGDSIKAVCEKHELESQVVLMLINKYMAGGKGLVFDGDLRD